MPRCRSSWRFYGDVDVGVTAKGPSGQSYSLVYVLNRNDPELPLKPGGSFTSSQLRAGVSWTVPEGYRCEMELVTGGNGAIDTAIELNGAAAECNPGRHCQGACTPRGSAGLAGSWAVTAARQSS